MAAGVLEDVGDEGGGGAFAFGAGDTDGLGGVALEEEVGLRSNMLRIDIGTQARQRDAGRLDDPVEGRPLLQESDHLVVVVGDGHLAMGTMAVEKTMGALPFPTVAGDEDSGIG